MVQRITEGMELKDQEIAALKTSLDWLEKGGDNMEVDDNADVAEKLREAQVRRPFVVHNEHTDMLDDLRRSWQLGKHM